MSKVRGIRGAITASGNSKDAILSSTKELITKMIALNKVKTADIAGIIFSATKDLNADFPANAARKLGLLSVPLLCTNEIDVPGSLKKCIRALMLVNSNKAPSSIKHVYLGGARKLRPDLE